jgi:hypothetical protein
MKGNNPKLAGLDLYRRGLDRDSWSQQLQKASLKSRENLNTFKEIVSTVEKSWRISMSLDNLNAAKSQLKSLDFKNLNQDWKSWNLDLDLHWSRLSRPPSLTVTIDNRKNVEQKLE